MGVFGFCNDEQCSRVSVGYDPSKHTSELWEEGGDMHEQQLT